jgi:hypothetical protein
LVQQRQLIAEGVANAGASANGNVERRLYDLASGIYEARDRIVNIMNKNIGFWTDVEVNDELRVGVRKGEPDRFVAPPQDSMPEAVAIEGDGRVKISDPQQKAIQLPK